MILIFDTYGGLCNQFYDIITGINFCLKHQISFTFRHCSFRNDNLCSWFQQPFEKLFDTTFLKQYPLYIDYHDIEQNITNENCFNFNGKIRTIECFNNHNIPHQLQLLNQDYIVLSQHWAVFGFNEPIDPDIRLKILPSRYLLEQYEDIHKTLLDGEPYNFLHYRYESDFTDYFQCTIEKLDLLLDRITFKQKQKIYIATSNIQNVLNLKENTHDIIYKDEEKLCDLNFEEKAFIDYMFGLHSIESYGHSKSSFSCMINSIKNCPNFFD